MQPSAAKSWPDGILPVLMKAKAFLYIRPLDKEVVVIAFKNKRQIAVAGIFKHQIVEIPY